MSAIVRLAVSGTYSTGKTTTTEALSIATGIPRTHAKTARELLLEILPGKQLEELSAAELIQLGLRRLEERIHHEAAQTGSFISDGSVIHEWVYGDVRMRSGINPAAGWFHKAMNEMAGLPVKRFYRQYMEAYGAVVKGRAKRMYDAYVHLPVEFELVSDNHRPVSEPFRQASDQVLVDTIRSLDIPLHIVGGSVKERLEKIVDIFGFELVMPLDKAIAIAEQRVSEYLAVIEADAKQHAQVRQTSWARRLKYAFRY